MTLNLGRFGVWTFGAPTPEQAAEIEKLGYGAIWSGGSPAADLAFVEPILAATDALRVATGIVNVWSAPAGQVAESYHRIEAAYPDRFILGIGVGHPEHTAHARQLIGPDAFLAPEHKVVLTDGSEQQGEAARAVGRETVDFYLNLSNYLNSWRRLGFSEDDIAKPGSDRLVDAVVAHGTPDTVADRLRQHLDAGADHVAVQVLGGWDKLVPTLTELAGPLGLKR